MSSIGGMFHLHYRETPDRFTLLSERLAPDMILLWPIERGKQLRKARRIATAEI